MNKASQGGQFSGCRGWQRMPFWDPKEEDFPPAGLSPPAGSSWDCQPLAQKEGFSPLPVVSPEELGRLRAGRKMEFIQSGVGSTSSSGASSPSGSEVRRIKVTDGPATRVLVFLGGGRACRTKGLTAQDRKEVSDGSETRQVHPGLGGRAVRGSESHCLEYR